MQSINWPIMHKTNQSIVYRTNQPIVHSTKQVLLTTSEELYSAPMNTNSVVATKQQLLRHVIEAKHSRQSAKNEQLPKDLGLVKVSK